MEAFFLPVGEGSRFCLFHAATGPLRGAFVHVHAFAEEMNLSRRMAALQVRALAAAGHAVLQIDLRGCGDSDGDFADADWSDWVADVAAAARWLAARTKSSPGYWGVRGGCLLAAEAARQAGLPATFLFWQPVISGALHWRQFLRIRQAAQAIGNRPAAAATSGDELATGVEVAGYRVSPGLARGLSEARLELPAGSRAVACIELSATGEALSPALADAMASWREAGREAGRQVRIALLSGPAFWQIPEAPDCPALVEASMNLLAACAGNPAP